MKIRLGAAALVATAGLAGCGGGGGSGSGNPTFLPAFSVGGTVSGLTGTGLVLQVNGGGNLGVSANGPFTFATRLTSGAAYNVGVLTQPTNPGQLCTVTGGSGNVGSANVTSVSVNCVPAFTIGGTVSGLAGTGLVLQNNGGDNLAIVANGPFAFSAAVVPGSGYNVTILTHSTSQTCTVASGSGAVGAANVTSVGVTCTIGFSVASVSDPLATQQWHLKNTGQAAFADSGGVAGMDINVDPVYTGFGYSGNGVTVAVVDTGLEIAHEDLAANVVPGGSWNFLNGTNNPTNTIDTDGDHGTSVSGLIAMARNTVGGIGVAPSAKLKGFNFLSSSQSVGNLIASLGGSGANPNSSDVHVFNASYGISPTNDTPINPTLEAQYVSGVNQLRGGKGAIYVKAAGNGFSNMGEKNNANCTRPSGPNLAGLSCENANFDPENAIPYQIVAGAINADGIKASYSSAGSAVWVSAPGGGGGFNTAVAGPGFVSEAYEPAMVTADQSGCATGFARTTADTSSFDRGTQNANCNYTNSMNGTSSATPVTAGVVALLLEANPALTWRDVKHILASTAKQIDPGRAQVLVALSDGNYIAEPVWTTNAAGFKFHNWYGFGMVDASAAVNLARTYTAGQFGAFVNTLTSSVVLNIAIPDNNTVGASNTLSVPGTVLFIEAVQISVSATHPFVGDLGIELLSPMGTRSVLKNIRDGFATVNVNSTTGVVTVTGSADLNGMVLLSNAFYGENPLGSWKITVVDGAAGNTGTLTGWSIRVYGH